MRKSTEKTVQTNEPLAIVGIGCRFPGGVVDVESFWSLLVNSKSGIKEVPEDRWNLDRYFHENPSVPGRMYTKWGGFIENLKEFDAQFWGITPREALRMDPQQRWLLEVAWEAIEDSGTAPKSIRGKSIGAFMGVSTHDYSGIQGETVEDSDVHTNSGITQSIISNRISYLLNLTGPAVSVDTACSSSLVALSIACRSIWANECDAALVGGVNCMCAPNPTVGFAKASMLSPDGQCFAFDERANGYVRGEGAAVVYLKKLKDAVKDNDRIYSLVKASVMNQDGNTSGMTVPNGDSQAKMIKKAYEEANIEPNQVMYFEAHGTGTQVGDVIEVSALGKILASGRKDDEHCVIGSVKSNIGHLEAGSGVAGLIKAALVLNKRQIPANQNFKKENPKIPFERLKLKVADKLQPLPTKNNLPPIASVNSFGFGGTNAHAVLESYTNKNQSELEEESESKAILRPFTLPISARNNKSLLKYVQSYKDFLSKTEYNIADICCMAGSRKEHHKESLLFTANNNTELIEKLSVWLDNEALPEEEKSKDLDGIYSGQSSLLSNDKSSLVFVFTGQGAQWWGMGKQLLEREPIFRQSIERIDKILADFKDFSLIEELNRREEDSRINDTNIAQPAIFALQVSLVELWKSWGISPSKVIGHSVGEVAAAYVAGIYSLEDAVKIIYHRSRLQNTTKGSGRMMVVGVPAKDIRVFFPEGNEQVEIAAINSSSLTTIAGNSESLEKIANQLENDKIFYKWLRVDYPFHTFLMDSIKEELLESLSDINPQVSKIPFISTVTGSKYSGEKMDASYWWANVRRPVLFSAGVENLIKGSDSVFLEIGPHPALKNPISDSLNKLGVKGSVFYSLHRKEDETQSMLSNVAKFYLIGKNLNWRSLNQASGAFVTLPSYPWNREEFWIEGPECKNNRIGKMVHPLLGLRLVAENPTWEFKLDPRIYTYLDSHQFWGSILFPAAGYGEISLALAREVFKDQSYTVEDILVKKALFLSEDKVPTVRVTLNESDNTFTIKSSTDLLTWDLNVTGKLTYLKAGAKEKINLSKLKSRLSNHISHEKYYHELAEAGFNFGPHFKLVKNVFYSKGEALIEVPLPNGEVQCEPGHHFHPILLDACLQVGKAAIDAPETATADKTLYLPRRLGRVRLLCKEIPERFWAHGIQKSFSEDMISFDIFVYNDLGEKIAEILDFRTEPMEHIRDDDVEDNLYSYFWIKEDRNIFDKSKLKNQDVVENAPPLLDLSTSSTNFIIFLDSNNIGESLAKLLESHGQKVCRIYASDKFESLENNSYNIRVDHKCDYLNIFSKFSEITTVIHSMSFLPSKNDLQKENIDTINKYGLLSAAKISQVLTELDIKTRVCFITKDAQCVIDCDGLSNPITSSINGFTRVAYNENPSVFWRTVDLDLNFSTEDITEIFNEILNKDLETEVAYRGRERFLKRIKRERVSDLPRKSKNAIKDNSEVTPFQVQIEKPGILSNLTLEESVKQEPAAGQIEAKVHAAGINFRNVMKALGLPIGNTVAFPGFGEDFSGIITRVGSDVKNLKPGDAVLGMAPCSFRSFVTTDARAVIKKPDFMSFLDAATIPTVFATAYYALIKLARIEKGEKILIHAGTGGVGQAAIQIAKSLELEIFATAGTPEKRQLLLDLGVHHAMDSRSLNFVDDVMKITNGKGVDCVLNSLSAEFIHKSLSVLGHFGRFIEIGKVDIHNNTKIGMELLKNNITYYMFDLIEYIVQKTDHIAEVYNELAEKFDKKIYKPLSSTVFPITKVEEAYRYMANGKHIGKNVLNFEELHSIQIGTCNEDGALFKKHSSYLVAGGTSGFGLEVAKWMAIHGAGHLILISRSGAKDEDSKNKIARLQSYGAKVTIAKADISKISDIKRVVDEIAKSSENNLAGVIHSAMVLHDDLIENLSDENFNHVLRPKINGAWNLHIATQELNLDHFICFSSFSAVIGAPKQASYNAANSFLDALSYHRQKLGLASLTINWGALSGAGFVARNKQTADYLDAIGMKSLNIDEALKVLRRSIQLKTPQILASRADWKLWNRVLPLTSNSNTFELVSQEEASSSSNSSIVSDILSVEPEQRASLMETFMLKKLSEVSSIDESDIDLEVSISDFGIDSLMMLELMNSIEGDLRVNIPMSKIFSGPSLRELVKLILEDIAPSDEISANVSDSEINSSSQQLTSLSKTLRKKNFPLSISQKEIWNKYLEKKDINNLTNFQAVKFKNKINRNLLRQSLSYTLKKHSLMKAVFVDTQKEVIQKLSADISLREVSVDGKFNEKYVESLSNGRHFTQFDLTKNSFKVELHKFSNLEVLIFSCHEIIADLNSLKIFIEELLNTYNCLVKDEKEFSFFDFSNDSYEFQDFVAWEKDYLNSDAALSHEEYWKDLFSNYSLSPNEEKLIKDSETSKASSKNVYEFHLDSSLSQKLLAISAELEKDLKIILFSCYKILMHYFSGKQEVLLTMFESGREHKELANLVGAFSKEVHVKSKISDPLTFAQIIEGTFQNQKNLKTKLYYPVKEILSTVAQENDFPLKSLFSFEMRSDLDKKNITSFNTQDYQILSTSKNSVIPGIKLTMQLDNDEIKGKWTYIESSFPNATIEKLNKNFIEILEKVAKNPQISAILEPLEGYKKFQDWLKPEIIDFSLNQALKDSKVNNFVLPEDKTFNFDKFDTVFLTGATGFVGAFLIDYILKYKKDTKIICLVRAKDEIEGLKRVKNNLVKYNLFSKEKLSQIEIVLGDLTLDNFGLSDEIFTKIATEIDVIYHNAASVNLVSEYEELKKINVNGTREILKLACFKKIKLTNIVSSYSVYANKDSQSDLILNENTPLPEFSKLQNGYAQTKWVVETMAKEAKKKGLPINIFRPGNITGDSVSGASNSDDFMHLILLGILSLGCIPDIDTKIDLTPVNYVAESIVSLSRNIDCMNGTYNLLNSKPLDIKDLVNLFNEFAFNIKIVSAAKWKETLDQQNQFLPTQVVKVLSEVLMDIGSENSNANLFAFSLKFDSSFTESFLKNSQIHCHPADSDLLSLYFSNLSKTDFFEALVKSNIRDYS